MEAYKKLLGGGSARFRLMMILILAAGGVYYMPRGEAIAGWIYVKDGPVVQIGPIPVVNTKGAKVTIAGVGFEPNQELGIRIVMGGAMSDVRFQVKPLPKTNDQGTFASEWVFGNELRLLGPGAHKLMVVNEAGEVLAHAPLVVAPAEKKAKDKK
jgi:hypothetical protein